MNFKHNDRVTCKILGTEITDARISIDEDGTPFICYEKNGGTTDDNLGYKYSCSLSNPLVTDLKLATPTWDSLSWKDIVLHKDGYTQEVLAVVNDMVCISDMDEFDTTSGWYTKEKLQEIGYTIEGAVPPLEEITHAEAEARFGVKIKTD